MPVRCVDAETLSDLTLFLERAERLGASSVRLNVVGSALVCTVPVLAPRSIGDATPLILAARVAAIEPADAADVVVSIRSVKERLARLLPDEAPTFELPPVTLNESWAGIAPPRTGWQPVADVDLDVLRATAEGSLGTLAELTTTKPEQLLAATLAMHDTVLDAPVGVAAAAQSLGFLAGVRPARLSRAGRWTRLSTPFGHVLSRG